MGRYGGGLRSCQSSKMGLLRQGEGGAFDIKWEPAKENGRGGIFLAGNEARGGGAKPPYYIEKKSPEALMNIPSFPP